MTNAPPESSTELSDVLWVGSDRELRALVETLEPFTEYAVDTEFHREKTYFPRLALVQIAWSGGCALIDPQAVDMTPLVELFGPEHLFVFHAFEQDLTIIDRSVGKAPEHLFDTQIASAFLGAAKSGLGFLLERYVGVVAPKADRLSDWTARPLTHQQLAYAASDVLHLLALKDALVAQLDRLGRREWVEEETQIQAERTHTETDPDLLWLKIKECRALSRESKKVARSLARWREERAVELDLPPRFILSDLMIASIAQARPRTAGELSKVRGVEPGRIGERAIADVLTAVADGLSSKVPADPPSIESELPRGSTPLLQLAAAWVGAKARTEHLDPAMLATREDISDFLFTSKVGRLSQGWRNELIGSDLTGLKEGRLAIRVGRNLELTLEELTN